MERPCLLAEESGDTLNEFAVSLNAQKFKLSLLQWISLHLPTGLKSIPKGDNCYDHFHVIKLMNERLCNIRRRIMRSLKMKKR